MSTEVGTYRVTVTRKSRFKWYYTVEQYKTAYPKYGIEKTLDWHDINSSYYQDSKATKLTAYRAAAKAIKKDQQQNNPKPSKNSVKYVKPRKSEVKDEV